MIAGVSKFAEEVRARKYPEPEHGYTMAPDEAAALADKLANLNVREPFSGEW
jgi:hypothetical protein